LSNSQRDIFIQLAQVREHGIFSARNASKGAMLSELSRILVILRGGYQRENIRELVFLENVFNKRTYENKSAVWKRLNHRYFRTGSDWIISCLVQSEANGINSTNFLSLAYLYYVLSDQTAFNFVTSYIWLKWKSGVSNINVGDFYAFINENKENAPELGKWRETTRNRLARNTLSALRDFGLLTGTTIKHIQRPTISSEAVYHLLVILWAEGRRGRALLEAEDWKLFLWNDADTANALLGLAQRGWIKFERSGQTVIVDLVRLPVEAGEDIEHA